MTLVIISHMGFVSSISASQCISGKSLEDHFDDSDYVFSGKVISINILEQNVEPKETFLVDDKWEPIEPDLSLSLTPAEVTIQVFYSWKGNVTDKIIVKPFVTMEPLGFQFIDGESYLVFAENIEWSDYPVVTGCGNTKPLSESFDTIRLVEQLANSDSQSEKDIEVNCNDYKDASDEIINGDIGPVVPISELQAFVIIDDFTDLVLIVLGIVGISVGIIIWRNRK
ncbi:hypothetical protein C5F50_08270 [Nitrosopumilus ureiphilus]|uniref:Uncharacterized protein n=1 Tax=Nitrosopumilus ureiphilus TaxID=1470067 RepID=A0A7D5RBK9_9ARCH|nr:hypothetical protein C5F50_08270 [Nitrosopumilus ureiphilus]